MFFSFPFHRMPANDKTTRADRAVASATNNNEAGNPGGDREVANTTTAAGNAGNAGKNKNKKKPVEKATSSSAVGESATAAKPEDVAKGPGSRTVTHEMWYVFDFRVSNILRVFHSSMFPPFTNALSQPCISGSSCQTNLPLHKRT